MTASVLCLLVCGIVKAVGGLRFRWEDYLAPCSVGACVICERKRDRQKDREQEREREREKEKE